MKFIEFIGLPGSGKSTILPIVKSHLQKLGFEVFDQKNIILGSESFPFNKRPFKKLLSLLPTKLNKEILKGLNNNLRVKEQYQLKYMLNNLEIFNYIINYTISRPIPDNHKSLVIKWFLKTVGTYQIARESLNSNSVLILDEGFVHRALTLFVFIEEKKINFEEIEKYLEKIPKAHTLIKVEADTVLCKKRLIDRRLPCKLEDYTDDEIWKYLLKAKSVIDFVQNFLTKRDTNIVALNNSSEEFIEKSIKLQLSKKLGRL